MPHGSMLVAAALAVAAVDLALVPRSSFLLHPGWLAVEAAVVVVLPVAVGVYWLRRRPQGRFGEMLAVFGLLLALLPLQAASSPALHTLGALAEGAASWWTFCLVLAFPSGRLDAGPPRWALAAIGVSYALWYVPAALFSPRLEGNALAACNSRGCPGNPFLLRSDPGFLAWWRHVTLSVFLAGVVLVGLLLVLRLVASSAARLSASAPGVILGLLFVVAHAAYAVSMLGVAGLSDGFVDAVGWTLVVADTFLPLGFLVALLGAEVAAGRLLRRLVDVSLGSRSLAELEQALRDALGDRNLRLGVWRRREQAYVDGAGRPLPPEPSSEREALTEAGGGDGRAIAILHSELRDEPELAETAVAGALLALDNVRLESDLDDMVAELRRSRARLVAASDAERRRIERDLHDGAQQQLVALRMKVGLALDAAPGDPVLPGRLRELADGLEQVLAELRELAHGIYPPILADAGLGSALEAAALRSEQPVTIEVEVGRYRSEIEAAVYYVCVEALQNAAKHGGPEAAPVVSVVEHDEQLVFVVVDHGCGFDVGACRRGVGLRNMEDRLGAVGGQLEVASAQGSGTVVSGTVPLGRRWMSQAARRKVGVNRSFDAMVGEP